MRQHIAPLYSVEAISPLILYKSNVSKLTQVDSSCCNYIDGGTTFSTQVAQSVLSGRFPTRETNDNELDLLSLLWEPKLLPRRKLRIINVDDSHSKPNQLTSLNGILLDYVFQKLNENNPSALNLKLLNWNSLSSHIWESYTRSQRRLVGDCFRSHPLWIEWNEEVKHKFLIDPDEIGKRSSRWYVKETSPLRAHKL